MKQKFVRKDEQIKLIMECRQSGLSDYQWCRQRDINPGTFYNWVSKLRKSCYKIFVRLIWIRKSTAFQFITDFNVFNPHLLNFYINNFCIPNRKLWLK